MLELTLLYACQMLRKEPEIDMEEEVRSSAELYIKALEVAVMRKRQNVQEVPEEPSLIHKSPPHILYHLSTYIDEEELFRKARNISAY